MGHAHLTGLKQRRPRDTCLGSEAGHSRPRASYLLVKLASEAGRPAPLLAGALVSAQSEAVASGDEMFAEAAKEVFRASVWSPELPHRHEASSRGSAEGRAWVSSDGTMPTPTSSALAMPCKSAAPDRRRLRAAARRGRSRARRETLAFTQLRRRIARRGGDAASRRILRRCRQLDGSQS